ncbi:uracil-DNA glycosylase [Qipengyuania sp. GPGPB31]|uniref:uracil-DNA glycosylase n=1 Tax=Qipengyuania sp. GPGPB31 TaxID=3023518 RepID=UPI0031344478
MATDEIPESWQAALGPVLATPQARQLGGFLVEEERAGKPVYPPRGCRLAALELTPLDAVKVVILGQDPYHGPGQAMGLCFAVPEGVKVPPSLANIYKELEADLGIARPAHGDLSAWARRGVLLLNSTLTVEGGKAASHAGRGWETVTDACVAAVAARAEPSVFILWGSHAQAKAKRIEGLRAGQHCVIESPHPSPLSAYRGFFGSRPFSRANAFLTERGRAPVDWQV